MGLINFTAQYDLFAARDPGSGDVNLEALVGDVIFTAQFTDDKAIQATAYSPRPTAFKILSFSGYMDVDGRLKSERGGAVGVRLPANDPVLELDNLDYRVDFRLTTQSGEPVRVASGYFSAPATDTVVELADVLETTGTVSNATDPLTVVRAIEILTAQAPAVVDANLDARNITFTDLGGGSGYFTIGGVTISGTLVPPGATWSTLAGKPSDDPSGEAITFAMFQIGA